VVALAKPNLKEAKDYPSTLFRRTRSEVAAGRVAAPASPTQRVRARAGTPWLLFTFGLVSVTALWRTRGSREDVLNRRAGDLYRRLAEQVFGPVRTERADVEDAVVSRIIVPLRGDDMDHELDSALDHVSAIHDKVETIAPELVGRIVFDYSSDGRHS
jgi:hypothetical protein